MNRRLLLGCGSAVHDAVERFINRSGPLTIVTRHETALESLDGDDTHHIQANPDDSTVYPSTADMIFIAGDEAEQNAITAETARAEFPHAHVTSHIPSSASQKTRQRINGASDRIVDARRALVNRFSDILTHSGTNQLHQLFATLRAIDGTLAIVMHDAPDPDAIASALSLVELADSVDVDADPCYYGSISHQENRALVNLLDLDLIELESNTDVETYDSVALVDHSRPGVNDGLDPATTVDIVIDHHPPRAHVEASFVDLRRNVGATSTIFADYLRRINATPSESVATALLFGIRTDTNDFAREVSTADFEAVAWLLTHADLSILEDVESPQMTSTVLETLSNAIQNRDVRSNALTSNVGEIIDRESLAQAADHVLNLEGINIVIIYGWIDDTVYLSGRARGVDIDLGETLRNALGNIGSAGGHADLAGAQIPLNAVNSAQEESSDDLYATVSDAISTRVFGALDDETTVLEPEEDKSSLESFQFPQKSN
jgi:Exopolyphosphatase-related proteins